ncbi:MAG TPA: hypothetical protein P5513_06195 [Candidatus Diapherotrites archaeon]|nr:hypothetical protein [Candidatus Diapherotrites archaeon]
MKIEVIKLMSDIINLGGFQMEKAEAIIIIAEVIQSAKELQKLLSEDNNFVIDYIDNIVSLSPKAKEAFEMLSSFEVDSLIKNKDV